MSGKTRYSREEALAKANEFLSHISDVVDRVEIAGSIRRGKPDVGDIELVIIPKVEIAQRSLFDDVDPAKGVNVTLNRLETLAEREIIKPAEFGKYGDPIKWLGRKDIKYVKGLLGELPIDLFFADVENWGYIYWLRTGPGDANQYMVTPHPHGLKPMGLTIKDGRFWQQGLIVPTTDEESVFDALGLVYVEPERRRVEVYREARRQYVARQRGEL